MQQGLMNIRICCFYICILISLFATNHLFAEKQSISVPEIHLLVDVSGSMKKTDPNNLRIPAIKMFLYLVNKKATMSINSFSTDVNTLITTQNVSLQFQNLFEQNKRKITSDGQWTDINAALIAVNKYWGKGKKIIILLTDGQVDLGSSIQNEESVNQLTTSTLKQMQDDKVQIYTIGLSRDADTNLLNDIATKTNGSSQTIEAAKDLDKVLYSIFTAIFDQDGTTLTKEQDLTRKFIIDKSINEFSIIIQKSTDKPQLSLSSPNGAKQPLIKSTAEGFSSTNYEIIKITKPAPGTWALSGPPQEMERVLILTEVQLETDFKSGVYFNKEVINIAAHLDDRTVDIDPSILLNQMKFSVNLTGGSKSDSFDMLYTENGLFVSRIDFNAPKGQYYLIVSAKNPLLSREKQYVVTLEEFPFKQQLSANGSFALTLLRPDLIKVESIALQINNEATYNKISLDNISNTGTINLSSLCTNPQINSAQIPLSIKAQNSQGRELLFNDTINLETCNQPVQQPINQVLISQISSIPHQAIKKTMPEPPIKVTPATPKKEAIESKSTSIVFISVILLIAIILVLIVVIQTIRYRRKINKIGDLF